MFGLAGKLFLGINGSGRKFNPARSAGLGEYRHFDRIQEEALAGYTPRQAARMTDSRDLRLGPGRIGDGIAISPDGRLSAVLKLGSVSLRMATESEQASIIGGYHALLRQLPNCQVQIKLRIEEANLSQPVERLDYAIERLTDPRCAHMARQHRQHLKEQEQQGLMEFSQYVIVSTANPHLARLEQMYESATGRPGFLSGDFGPGALGGSGRFASASFRANPEAEAAGLAAATSGRASRNWLRALFAGPGRGRAKIGQAGAGRPARGRLGGGGSMNLRRERQEVARRQSELEQDFYDEMRWAGRNLEHQVAILAGGLAAIGLTVRRLPDWELTALYLAYLRPELAGSSRSAPWSLAGSGQPERPGRAGFLQGNRPHSPAEFAGGLSQSVVASELPAAAGASPAYERNARRVRQAMTRPLEAGISAGERIHPAAAGRAER